MAYDMGYQQFCNPIKPSEGGLVTFRDDYKDKIISIGNFKIGTSPLIENVALVDDLKHNLLSISQLYDKGLRVIFDGTCDVDKKNNSCVFSDFRENNIYIIGMRNLDYHATCLFAINEDP